MNESQKIKLSLIGIVLLLILATVYVFWVQASDGGTVPEVTVHQSETGRNIRDAEQRVESIGKSIDSATESTRKVQDGIDESARRAKEVQESIRRTKSLIEESRGLSKEGRRILESLPEVDGK